MPLCIKFLQSNPKSDLSGSIAGRLLSTLASAKAQTIPLPVSDLSAATDFLVKFAWEKVEDENNRGGLQDQAAALAGLIRLQWCTETTRVRNAIQTFLLPRTNFATSRVVGVWLSVPESRAEAMALLLDDSINEEQRFRARAGAAARNLPVIFEELSKPISERHMTTLCRLLEQGVGDFKRSPDAGWSAWSRYGSWPEVAIAYLWRGVLRSSLEGFTMRRDMFWPDFEAWFHRTQDAQCLSILENAGLYPVEDFAAET
jgi:hypothetical protein